MGDKSPHDHKLKKPSKSIKQKRAEKHAKGEAKTQVETLLLPHK